AALREGWSARENEREGAAYRSSHKPQLTRLRGPNVRIHASPKESGHMIYKTLLAAVALAAGPLAAQHPMTGPGGMGQTMDNAMWKAHWAMITSAAQARAVLTEAQLSKMQTWADSMQTWTQQHRQMMKPGELH